MYKLNWKPSSEILLYRALNFKVFLLLNRSLTNIYYALNHRLLIIQHSPLPSLFLLSAWWAASLTHSSSLVKLFRILRPEVCIYLYYLPSHSLSTPHPFSSSLFLTPLYLRVKVNFLALQYLCVNDLFSHSSFLFFGCLLWRWQFLFYISNVQPTLVTPPAQWCIS